MTENGRKKVQTPASLGLVLKSQPKGNGRTIQRLRPAHRPSEVVKAAYAEAAVEDLPTLRALIKSEATKPEARINGILGMARVGAGEGHQTAAQWETPEGFKFTLILGERDLADD